MIHNKQRQSSTSLICPRFQSKQLCAHEKCEVLPIFDPIYESVCLPTLREQDLFSLLGGDKSQLEPITREQLYQFQSEDADITLMRSYLLSSFPSLTQFKSLYASQRATYFFSLRMWLLLTPDHIVCVRRRPGQEVMEEESSCLSNLPTGCCLSVMQ